jgi:hypothetical protein
MDSSEEKLRLWSSWLLVVVIGVICFGLFLVLLPDLSSQGFSWLIYGSFDRISQFTPEATHYITLVHAVFGSVLIGWGITILYIIQRFYRKGNKNSWGIIAISILAWFIPDTVFSIVSGFTPNVLLNLVFLILFFIPLGATLSYFRKRAPNFSQ